jgi:hypothetical protein
MQGILTFVISAIVGYLFFLYLSHPEKKKNKLPKISIGRLDVLPNFRLHIGSKTYWFHHWFVLSIIVAIPIIIGEDFQFPMVIEGLLVGGILQGLRYPDRFKFRHPRLDKLERQLEEFRKEVKKEVKDFTTSVKSGEIFEQLTQFEKQKVKKKKTKKTKK